jgi:hypothetical protein
MVSQADVLTNVYMPILNEVSGGGFAYMNEVWLPSLSVNTEKRAKIAETGRFSRARCVSLQQPWGKYSY